MVKRVGLYLSVVACAGFGFGGIQLGRDIGIHQSLNVYQHLRDNGEILERTSRIQRKINYVHNGRRFQTICYMDTYNNGLIDRDCETPVEVKTLGKKERELEKSIDEDMKDI